MSQPDKKEVIDARDVAASVGGTIATFAKGYVPFLYIGSNIVFSAGIAASLYFGRVRIRNFFLNRDRYNSVILASILILHITALLSAIIVSYPQVKLTYFVGMTGLNLLFLLIGIASAQHIRSIIYVLMIMGAVYVIYVVAFLVANHGTLFPEKDYFGDVFALANKFGLILDYRALYQNVGQYLSLGFLAAFFLLNIEGNILLMIGFFASSAYLVGSTSTRSAFLGLLLTLGLSSISRGMWLRLAMLAALGTIAVFASSTLQRANIIERLESYIRSEIVDFNSQGAPNTQAPFFNLDRPAEITRMALLSYSLDTIRDNPSVLLRGRGLGMFSVDTIGVAPDWLLNTRSAGLYPHNPIVEAFYELGVVGAGAALLIYLVPIFAAFRLSRGNRDAQFAAALFFFILLVTLASGSLAYGYRYYFGLGLLLAVSRAGPVSVPTPCRLARQPN